MQHHHRVNLRTPSPSIQFGSEADQEKYEAQLERDRAAQTTKYAVTRMQSLLLPDGRILPAGYPVTLADFVGTEEPAWRLLERALARGIVLENYDIPPDDNAAA